MADLSHAYPLLQGASKGYAQLFTSNKSATAAAVGTVILPNSAGSFVKDAKFEYISNGSETMTISGSYDGTNFQNNLVPIITATGLPSTVPTALVEAAYTLPRTWNFTHYKFIGSSTVDVKTIAFAALVVPK